MHMHVSLAYICKAHIILKLTERNMKKLGISKRQISKLSPDIPRAERQEKGEGRNPQLVQVARRVSGQKWSLYHETLKHQLFYSEYHILIIYPGFIGQTEEARISAYTKIIKSWTCDFNDASLSQVKIVLHFSSMQVNWKLASIYHLGCQKLTLRVNENIQDGHLFLF